MGDPGASLGSLVVAHSIHELGLQRSTAAWKRSRSNSRQRLQSSIASVLAVYRACVLTQAVLMALIASLSERVLGC